MDFERIRAYWKNEPFRKFNVHLSDGQSLEVRHPERMIVTDWVIVIVDPEDDVHMVDPQQVVSIEYGRGRKGA